MEKHTPTPWKVTKLSHADDQLWLQITGPDGRGPIVRVNSPGEPMPDGVIAESKYLVTPEDNQLANADFIVRACNSHDALLAACKLALVRFAKIRGKLEAAVENEVPLFDDGETASNLINDEGYWPFKELNFAIEQARESGE